MRSPGSGAYLGGSNQQRKTLLDSHTTRVFRGDIVPPPEWQHLNIECKFYREFPFHQLIQGVSVKMLDTWIQQSLTVAEPQDITLIIMKFNRCGSYILAPAQVVWDLPQGAVQYTSPPDLTWWFADFEKFLSRNVGNLKKNSLV